MLNQEENKDFLELIPRYLSGNTSDKEVQELEAWVLADAKNKAQFIAFKKAWMLSGMKENKAKVSVNELWKDTSGKLFKEAEVVDIKARKGRRRWLAIAASLAVIILAVSLIYGNMGEDSQMAFETNDEIKAVDLPDGTKVTLNQSSALTYELLENNQRSVNLQGDAFFDVKREERQPFVIKADDIEVEVLGTSFYVDARSETDEIQVIVNSGSVAVRSGNSETILKANEKAVFNKRSTALFKVENDDPNFMALTNNKLVFSETRLEEVVFALNRQFNAAITIQNDILKNCTLNAVYENKSLAAILTILESSLTGIKVEQTGEKIVLTGTDCN